MSALLEELQELRETIHDANIALASVQESLSQLVQPVVDGLDDLDDAIEEAGNEVDNVLEGCVAVCENVEEETANVLATAEATGEALNDLSQKADESLDGLSGLHDAAMSAASGALEEARQKVGDVEAAIENLTTSALAAANEILESMMSGVAERLIRPIEEAREAAQSRIDGWVDEVAEEILPMNAKEIYDDLQAELLKELDDMLESLRDGFSEFSDSLFGGSDKARESRMTSELAREVLDAAFAPILGQLDRLRSLAGSVGIGI